jgi:hypothetical protein
MRQKQILSFGTENSHLFKATSTFMATIRHRVCRTGRNASQDGLGITGRFCILETLIFFTPTARLMDKRVILFTVLGGIFLTALLLAETTGGKLVQIAFGSDLVFTLTMG